MFSLCEIECLTVTALEIMRDYKNNPILSQVFCYVKSRWSEQVENDLKPYWNHRYELCIEGGCLMLGVCVVVPWKLQRKVLEKMHQNYPSIVKNEILGIIVLLVESHGSRYLGFINLVQASLQCQSVRNAPSVSPLHLWLWSSKPWVRIYVDFAGLFQKKMFILIVNAHSKWPEIIDTQCYCR